MASAPRKGVKPGAMDAQAVSSFREKPDRAAAEKFVAQGNFYWNAGMFFWKASTALDLLRHHLPKTATLLAGLPPFGSRAFGQKLAEIYPMCENISVDYGIMEKAASVSGLPVDDIRWNDVGSWEAVYALASKDKNGNAARGELVAEASSGNYVDAAKTVALVGVEDLVIVDTPDALLIAHRSKSQDVSKLVKTLEAKKREELL